MEQIRKRVMVDIDPPFIDRIVEKFRALALTGRRSAASWNFRSTRHYSGKATRRDKTHLHHRDVRRRSCNRGGTRGVF
jgi:hypothetical protein